MIPASAQHYRNKPERGHSARRNSGWLRVGKVSQKTNMIPTSAQDYRNNH